MLSEGDQRLFFVAKHAQVTRNAAIAILNNSPIGKELLVGAVVRLLVELPSHQQDYAAAFVAGTEDGEPYSGFAVGRQRSTHYLVLRMPRELIEINGCAFQLNSISNSTIQEGEFGRCLHQFRANALPIPTIEELQAVADRVQPFRVNSRLRNLAHVPPVDSGSLNGLSLPALRTPSPPAAAPVVEVDGDNPTSQHLTVLVNATSPLDFRHNQPIANFWRAAAVTGSPKKLAAEHSNKANCVMQDRANEDRCPQKDVVDARMRESVLQKLQENNTVFPKQGFEEIKVSQLSILERDMNEYLHHVREAMSRHIGSCVVCADHVPSIIILPCKHKVMCRLCATEVQSCPFCRSAIIDMFEVAEV